MKYLEGKDLDAENDFYNNLFGEKSSDENFSAKSLEEIAKDSFDSDFDNSKFKSSENDFSDLEGLYGKNISNKNTKQNEKSGKLNGKKKTSKKKVFPNKNKHFKENNKKCSLGANNNVQNNHYLKENNFAIHPKNESDLVLNINPDGEKLAKINDDMVSSSIAVINKNGVIHEIQDDHNEEKNKINEEEEEEDEDYISMKKPKKKPKIIRRITNKNFIDNNDNDDDDFLNKKRQRVKLHRREKEKAKAKEQQNNKNVNISNDYSLILINKGYLKKEAIARSINKKVSFKEEIKKEKFTEFNKVSNLVREKPSQKDLLYEAIFTEIYNIKSLEDMQRLEELNKRDTSNNNKKQLSEYVKIQKRLSNYVKREHEPEMKQGNSATTCTNINEKEKKELDNPETIQIIKDEELIQVDDKTPVTEKTLLTFSDSDIYKKIFDNFNKKQDIKLVPTCSVSGEKAKYYDPITKQYYSNIENFKILRERYFQKEEDSLLFRIQTLSDLTSQKKERLKKMILSNCQTSIFINAAEEATNKSILSLVNKYGNLKEGDELEKKIINRI